jgi:hypothetical protein
VRGEKDWASPATRPTRAGRLTWWGEAVSGSILTELVRGARDVGLELDRTVERRRRRRREAGTGTAEEGGRRRSWAPAINDIDAAGRCR